MGYPSNAELIESAQAFGESVQGAQPRWLYCLSRVKQAGDGRLGPYVTFAERTIKASARIIGAHVSGHRYRALDRDGFDAIAARYKGREINPFPVGPLEAWHLGHVYFVRVRSHPHVLKVGFSRRVRDRIEDIESRNKTQLIPRAFIAGTMLDEHWWHNNWRHYRIAGEWFFDPQMTDRTLPSFLTAPHSSTTAPGHADAV